MTTVEISLTQGKFAVVDEADLHIVENHKWHYVTRRNLEYAETILNGRSVLMHRLIENAPKRTDVDHRDSNGLNNSRSNLRQCTRQQNMMNRRKLKVGTSKYKGVWKFKSKWKSGIKIDRKSYSLGTFATELEAAKAYDDRARSLFGEFARTNF